MDAAGDASPAPWVEERFPDTVVVIDFGMTCTDMPPFYNILRALCRRINNLSPQASPTQSDQNGDPPKQSSIDPWGFGCDGEEHVSAIKEFFKLHLAPHELTNGSGITQDDARRWFQDYISCIYEQVVSKFNSTIPGIKRMRVEFIFSVPTTWKDDVNVLKLASSRGRPIGSVFIDRTMHKLITDKLSKIEDHLTQSPHSVAWKMLSSRLQRLKCAFGAEATRTPRLSLEVTPLKAPARGFPVATIYDGQMHIEEYVQRAFDAKINEMCDLLDRQIYNIDSIYPWSRIVSLYYLGI
ncbi:hypothetical protein BDV12DRAFT_199120 [Aspergillus spectabilis]